MAQEQVGKEAATVALDHRHARRVDGRYQRGQSDALEHPVRSDRQNQTDRRVNPGQRSHEQHGDAKGCMLEPVRHPAMGRDGAAAHKNGRHQQNRGPGRRRGPAALAATPAHPATISPTKSPMCSTYTRVGRARFLSSK